MRAKPALLGEFDEFLSFVDISENVITFVGTAGENLYAGGGTGWYMDLFTNHSKPCSIGQKHFANYSNSVVIDYPGSQTTAETTDNRYTGKPLPESPFVCFCYKLWFEAIPFVGRRTVLSTILAWVSRKSAHIRTRTSSSL